jgi:hypothetical protein
MNAEAGKRPEDGGAVSTFLCAVDRQSGGRHAQLVVQEELTSLNSGDLSAGWCLAAQARDEVLGPHHPDNGALIRPGHRRCARNARHPGLAN